MTALIQRVTAVICAKEEQSSIENVLRQLLRAGVHDCVLVINGDTDERARERAARCAADIGLSLQVLVYLDALGPDVGKIIGTYAALRCKQRPGWLVYVDGDWKGSFGPMLGDFMEEGMLNNCDCQWVSHTGQTRPDIHIWQEALRYREPRLMGVSPAESPVLVKVDFWQQITPLEAYHPGRWLALALNAVPPLRLRCSDKWNVAFAGNPVRSARHQALMADTLIGDALEGACLLFGLKPSRMRNGKTFEGFHNDRRLDLLADTAARYSVHNED